MEVEYSQHEFERLVRGSFKHGWLHKRSKGIKAVIPRKRYFVLCDDCLYWFKKDKTKFVQQGVLDIVDMKITNMSSDSLQIEKRSNGKVHILSGSELNEWAKTLEATLLPLSSLPKELKLSTTGSEGGLSSKESGKLSRKSTGASGGLSSALSSLPCSNTSSLLYGESNPSTPQADLSDTGSLDDNLIGRPILTEETLEKHNSTMDSIHLNLETLGFHNNAMDSRQDTFRLDITKIDTPECELPEVDTPIQKAVRSAISFFENMAEQVTEEKKSARVRQRLFSNFGPETKSRLRASPGPTSPKSVGGDSIPEMPSEQTLQFDEGSESSLPEVLYSEASLLSKELAQTNLKGTQTLDELALSLANMMNILDSMNDTIESQTQTNLFLFERGKSLLPNESESTKGLLSATSEPSLLRIPSDRENELGVRRSSSYRLSVDYRSRSSTQYTAQKSAMSLISLVTADSDSVSSIPEIEDVDLDIDERFADIEEYIHSRLIIQERISMVDLTNCFKGKRLPKEAFRKLYDQIRKRIEIDTRISRRQPENLSQLSLVSLDDSYFRGSTHEFCNMLRRQHRLSTMYNQNSDLIFTQ